VEQPECRSQVTHKTSPAFLYLQTGVGMSFLSRLVQMGYVLGLSLVLTLLLKPTWLQAQFGAPPFSVSAGYRGSPGFPTVAIPVISGSGSASGASGGIVGGAGGSGSVSGSFTTQIIYINIGSFLPNGGRLIGLPPPTFMPPLNNQFYDTTGAPWATTGAMSMGGGGSIGIITPLGGGIGGGSFGMGGGGIGGGGMGGFAGKGMGGFNGKNGL
jgi:hypothetical protein